MGVWDFKQEQKSDKTVSSARANDTLTSRNKKNAAKS